MPNQEGRSPGAPTDPAKIEGVLKPLDTTESGRALHRFTSERMGDEYTADQNIDKDPVGPIKARARTTAMVNALRAPGGNAYGDRVQRKNNPDNAFVKKP